jgi:NTE family protein
MASIAIPGIFAPAKTNGDLIVDGGVINPIPIGTLIKLGINKVIAVNVIPSPADIGLSNELKSRRAQEELRQAESKGFFARMLYRLGARFKKMVFPNIMDVIVNSIQTLEYVIAEGDCQKANIVIRPIAIGVDWFEFFKTDLLVGKGEEEARKALPAIKNMINE